ncbi:hypothetical protein RYX36_018772 [Vicia faba]
MRLRVQNTETLHLRDKRKTNFSSLLFQRTEALSSSALSDLKHCCYSHRLHCNASPPFMSSSSASTSRPRPNPLRRALGFAHPVLNPPSPFESMLDPSAKDSIEAPIETTT